MPSYIVESYPFKSQKKKDVKFMTAEAMHEISGRGTF